MEKTIFLLSIVIVATSLMTSSATIMISFIGFSEYLAFLPIVNLNYPLPLIKFFRGISGVNFALYEANQWLTWLPLPVTGNESSGMRYENAGFENVAFFQGGADIFLIILLAIVNVIIMLLLFGILKMSNICEPV